METPVDCLRFREPTLTDGVWADVVAGVVDVAAIEPGPDEEWAVVEAVPLSVCGRF